MKPHIFPITITRNEDQFISATLRAWIPFADTMFVQDTGSIDRTMGEICDVVSSYPGKVMVGQYEMGVGESLVERQRLIDRIPKDHDYWILVLDADEIWPESQIKKAIALMSNPEFDYIGTRQVPIGWDGRTCYDPRCLQPPDPADVARFTTMYWCPKFTTRLFRSTRLDGVCNPVWGGETLYVKFDEDRHTLTDDFKRQPVPDGCINTMFSGRTNWTDIYFWHATNLTRSSKWREIPQTPGSNATNRRRCPSPAPYSLPPGVDVPESMMQILRGLERV